MLSREDILGAADLRPVPVEVPEWGGTVLVRALSGADRDAWEAEQYLRGLRKGSEETDVARTLENLRARFVVLVACNAKGERLFRDEDAEALGQKSGAALDRVWTVAQKVNALTAEDLEALRGNSGGGPSAASGS